MTALAARADAVAALAQAGVGESMSIALAAVRARLAEPIRVAVAGPVKAGKSTLVNALLRQLVAPTDVSECTQVVTEFRYGYPERAELTLRDGSRMPLALERGGRLPTVLGVDPSQVAALRVWLTNDVLQSMTLIDTPGLNSANEDVSARTEEMLLRMDTDSRWAVDGADVVLFAINAAVNATDLGTLREHYLTTTGSHGSALTALGVLTKADKVGSSGEPWLRATQLAQTQSERLQAELAAVVPVLGLLAETAETYELTEVDAADIATLAGLGTSAPDTMLWSGDHFMAADLPIPAERRVRLLSKLDIYGIGLALGLVRDEGLRGAGELQQALARRAGLVEVRRILDESFARRADALKTYDALNRMTVLSYRGTADEAPALARLRAGIEALRDDPAMHEVTELTALNACLTGAIDLPDDLYEDALRLAKAADPAQRCGLDLDASREQIMRAAAAGAAAWKAYANSGATTSAQATARVLVRTYSLLFEQVQRAVSV